MEIDALFCQLSQSTTTDCSFNCPPFYTNLHKLISKFMSWVNSGNIWAFHLIFRFSFWLTKLPKMKIGCMIFCTGKTKMKNNKEQTNYYVIILFFVTFVNQNEKQKWDEKIIYNQLLKKKSIDGLKKKVCIVLININLHISTCTYFL